MYLLIFGLSCVFEQLSNKDFTLGGAKVRVGWSKARPLKLASAPAPAPAPAAAWVSQLSASQAKGILIHARAFWSASVCISMITSFLFGCAIMSGVCYGCIQLHIWVSKHTAGTDTFFAVSIYFCHLAVLDYNYHWKLLSPDKFYH